jgi:hypothetical protein
MLPSIQYRIPGPIENTCLEEFADAIQKDPFGTWILLPTRWLSEYVTGKLLQTYDLAVLPDHITTPGEFANLICRTVHPEIPVLSREEEAVLFRDILKSGKNLEKFLPSGTVTAATIADLVSLRRGLDQNESELTPASEKLRILSYLIRKYHEKRAAAGALDSEAVYRKAGIFLSGDRGKIPVRHLCLYGFHDTMPIEDTFLEILKNVAEICVIVQPYAENPAIFSHIQDAVPSGSRKELETAEGLFSGPKHRIPASQNVSYTLYPDEKSELAAVFDEICGLLENGVSAGDILILSPELPKITTAVRIADDIIGDFSVKNPDGTRTKLSYATAGGRPLSSFPAIRLALTLLKVSKTGYRKEELVFLLRYAAIRKKFNIRSSDLLKYAGETGTISGKEAWSGIEKQRKPYLSAQLEQAVSDRGTEDLEEKILCLETFQKNLNAFITYLDHAGKRTACLREHAGNLRKAIDDLKLFDNLSPEEQQAANQFEEMLLRLTRSRAADRTMLSGWEFYEILEDACGKTGFTSSSREKQNSIRILGLREAAHTPAKHVFIIGLTARSMPGTELTFPFLTRKETAGILSKKPLEKYLLAEKFYFLAAVLTASESLRLSSPVKTGRTDINPSPFLTRFDEKYRIIPKSFLSHSRTANQIRAGNAIREGEFEVLERCFGISSYRHLAGKIILELSGRSGSFNADFSAEEDLACSFQERYPDETAFPPTDLEMYADCPFRWYLEKHLRLRIPQDPGNEEAVSLGMVVHRIMQRFFENYGKPVSAADKKEAEQLILTIGREEFNAAGLSSPYWKAVTAMYLDGNEETCVPPVLSAVLDYEIENYGAFTQQLLEYQIQTGIPVSGSAPLNISGRADRIDISDKGRITVLDYKTGNVRDQRYTYRGLAGGFALQLPLYLAAITAQQPELSIKGSRFYQISPRSIATANPFAKSEDIRADIESMMKRCSRYRTDMQSGVCSPEGKNRESHRYCPFRYICRYALNEEGA